MLPSARWSVLLVTASVLVAGHAVASHAGEDAHAILMGGLQDEAVDSDGDGEPDTLRLGFPVRAPAAGTFRVNASFSTPSFTSRDFTVVTNLTPGDHVVRVSVPGDYVRNSGHTGTFGVLATLRTGTGFAGNATHTHAYTTQGYTPQDWPAPAARLHPEPVAVPRDADADGSPDALRVDVPVNVTRSGEYAVTLCWRSAGVTTEACRPPANVTLTRPGGLVTFIVPVHALPLNASAFTLDARVELAERDPSRALHGLEWTSPAFRSAAFTGGGERATNATAAPVTAGRVLESGVTFSVDAHLETAARRDVRVILTDSATGESVVTDASHSSPDAVGRVTLTVTVPAADAARILATAEAPVLHWAVRDGFGLILSGGRLDLPGAPLAGIVIESEGPLVVGDSMALVDASTVPRGTVATRSWRVDGEPAGDAARETVTLTERGTRTVALTVTNAWGVSGTTTRDIRVGANLAPKPTVASEWRLNEGEASALKLTATDPEGRAVAWRLVDAPDGVTLTGSTLAWTPDYHEQGAHEVLLALTDDHHDVDVSVKAIVWNRPAPPDWQPPTDGDEDGGDAGEPSATITGVAGRALPVDATVIRGEAYRLIVEATDSAGGSVRVTLDERPEGATFANGVLEWDDPAPGRHVLRFSAPGAEDAVVVLVVKDLDGAVPAATRDPLAGVAFVTPAVAAGLAVGVGLVLRRRARRGA